MLPQGLMPKAILGIMLHDYSETRVDGSRNPDPQSRRDHQGAATLHKTQRDTVILVSL